MSDSPCVGLLWNGRTTTFFFWFCSVCSLKKSGRGEEEDRKVINAAHVDSREIDFLVCEEGTGDASWALS